MGTSKQFAKGRQRINLLHTVATQYWEQGISQNEIARALGYSRPQVSRLLSEARKRGIVTITVRHPLKRAIELEHQLSERFGLAGAHVAADGEGGEEGRDADVDSSEAPVVALGAETAMEMIRGDSVVALTNGNAVSQVVAALPKSRHPEVTIVQAIGAIAHDNHLIDSPELCQKMAGTLGANYRILPAPFYLDSSRTASILRHESSISMTISMASHADVILTGIGATTKAGSGAIFDLWLGPSEVSGLVRAGAVGHIGGHHIDSEGRHIDGDLCRRILGVPFNRLKDATSVLAIAWGQEKIPAIAGALRGGLVSHLVTDVRTASGVLALENGPGKQDRR